MNNNLSIIQSRGKEIFGEHFCVFPEDHEVLQKLLTWFLQDEQGAIHYNINLHKGILLTGPIGCGKTSLMSLMRLLVPQQQRFGIKSCREITFDFISIVNVIPDIMFHIQRQTVQTREHRGCMADVQGQ